MFAEDIKTRVINFYFIRMLRASERKGGSSKWEIKKKEKEKKKKKKSGNLTNFEAKTGRITVDAARNLRGYGN